MKPKILHLAAYVLLLSVMSASASVRYVNVSSVNPAPPYTNWTIAAKTIQEAIDAAEAGDQILVTNGVYQTGERIVSRESNRVEVNKAVTVQSLNGPAETLIQGGQAVRCVYLTNGAALVGFTLFNGVAFSGGGAWCESANAVLSNCVLTGNSATNGNPANSDAGLATGGGAHGGTLNNCIFTRNSAYAGGGAVDSILNNCTLSANSATSVGGGVYGGILNSCTLSGNSAAGAGGTFSATLNNCTLTDNYASYFTGGGAADCALNNCIIYYNRSRYDSSPDGDNYTGDCLFSYSCTTPLPTNGIANLTNAPLFVDSAHGNLRLQPNSPCINAGSNASAPPGADLDGNPRIVGGTVDMGAYEFQSPQSLISYAWLQQYSLPFDGSADNTDLDGDGLNNWQEWRTGTNPTNALSALRLLSPAPGAPGLIVSWQSVVGLNYFLERSANLDTQPAFIPRATHIIGEPGTTTFTDTNAVGPGPFFYRVGVQD